MAGTDARIRIKLGQIEIEYEGDAKFLKADLLETVKQVLDLQKTHPAAAAASAPPAAQVGGASGGEINYSTDTIATMLGANSGPEVVIAAAAHLHFVKGNTTFTSKEISTEVRTATSHFKKSFLSNLRTILKSLTKRQRLRLGSAGTYSLSGSETQKLKAKLAEG